MPVTQFVRPALNIEAELHFHKNMDVEQTVIGLYLKHKYRIKVRVQTTWTLDDTPRYVPNYIIRNNLKNGVQSWLWEPQ